MIKLILKAFGILLLLGIMSAFTSLPELENLEKPTTPDVTTAGDRMDNTLWYGDLTSNAQANSGNNTGYTSGESDGYFTN